MLIGIWSCGVSDASAALTCPATEKSSVARAKSQGPWVGGEAPQSRHLDGNPQRLWADAEICRGLVRLSQGSMAFRRGMDRDLVMRPQRRHTLRVSGCRAGDQLVPDSAIGDQIVIGNEDELPDAATMSGAVIAALAARRRGNRNWYERRRPVMTTRCPRPRCRRRRSPPRSWCGDALFLSRALGVGGPDRREIWAASRRREASAPSGPALRRRVRRFSPSLAKPAAPCSTAPPIPLRRGHSGIGRIILPECRSAS